MGLPSELMAAINPTPMLRRPTRFRGELTRKVTLLMLLALPAVLLDRGNLLVSDSEVRALQQADDAHTTSLGLAPAPETGEDSEDDLDDVLPHDFTLDSARAAHQPAEMAARFSSTLALERPHRPPIG